MAIPPLNQTPRDPKKPTNWARVSKTLSFWILIILIPVAFIQFSSRGADQAPLITYSQYTSEVERDNVAKATFLGERGLTGEFKTPVTLARPEGGTTKPVRKFNVKLPVANSDKELERLATKGVTIDAREQGPS